MLNYTRFVPLNLNGPGKIFKAKVEIGLITKGYYYVKMLRENDFGYQIEPVGMGLGIGLVQKSRKIPISLVDNPMPQTELLNSR